MSKKKLVRIEDCISEDWKFMPGEEVEDWLLRQKQNIVASITAIGVNPANSAKTRLDALKLLMSRALPERAIQETVPRTSELDHMSDSEVAEWLEAYLAKLKKDEKSKRSEGKLSQE